MTFPRPIPGSPIVGPKQSQSINGDCPTCVAPVLWVRDQTYGADGSEWYAPLNPELVAPIDDEDVVFVAVSPSGSAAAITPQRLRVHRCPKSAVAAVLARVGSMGFYTAAVLAVSCPLPDCHAAPGMLCVSPRRDALLRPHGARLAVA